METVSILEISGYPPPYGGWTMRTEQLKKRLEAEGYLCVVLNTGETRKIPNPAYETVENGWVYVRKVWRYCRRGFLLHTHTNGEAPKGLLLAVVAQIIGSAAGAGSVLTFHAGVDQLYFPRAKSGALLPVFKLLFALPRFIVCNAESVKARIVEYGVAPEKIVAIPAFTREYVNYTPARLPDPLERHFASHRRILFSYLALRATFTPGILLTAFTELARTDSDLGLVVCGVGGHAEPEVTRAFNDQLQASGVADRICVVGDLTHDQFLTAMTRSVMYVRTPVSDGVCSSVLEALTLGVTVVASDNGTRPQGVVTFDAGDPASLARAIQRVLATPPVAASRPVAEIPDTLRREVDLLVCARLGGAAASPCPTA